MSTDIALSIGKRIKEYCTLKNLDYLQITLHGGEPLLLGEKKLDQLITILRTEAQGINLKIGLQTNGVLLNEKLVYWLLKNNISVGISLDGDWEGNSRRVDFKGAPTFEKTVKSINLMQRMAPNNLIGILSVVNMNVSAEKTIRYLCELKPKQLDLLLPFETHDSLGDARAKWADDLGVWLNEAFEVWFSNSKFNHTKIRIFEDVLQSVITSQPKTDWFGVRNISYLVIGTNGDIDILDHLKVIGQFSIQHRSTYKNIMDDSIESAESVANQMLDKFMARKLPDKCGGCEWQSKCCGGYLPHRFSSRNKFNNPSVACEAIQKMYSSSAHIMKSAIHNS